MTVAELIAELQKLPQDLTVMAAGETAQKVIVEECQGDKYVRIFEPWDVEYTGRFEPIGADVLDKISAEIDEQWYKAANESYDAADGLEMALHIIDKYRGEKDAD